MIALDEVRTQAKQEWETLYSGDVPLIMVGTATCGRSAGSLEVLQTLIEETQAQGVACNFIEVGCIGLCYAEPIVCVLKPGQPGVCYGEVNPAKAQKLVENYLLGDDPLAKFAMGTFGEGNIEGIPKLFETSVLEPQVRRALRNCGFIDPANNSGAAVPFSAATDGRDHWLSAGEPHCADCHQAPFVESSGNITPFPPFNYPAKASLMRYSRGHQDVSCQGCHESIHGLYPVTPTIDTTSYAQAAALNPDGSHGPIQCGACHEVDGSGIPSWIRNNPGGTLSSIDDLDSAIVWAHTYTEEESVLDSTCQNCHGVKGNNWDEVISENDAYIDHNDPQSQNKHMPRGMMDKAEIAVNGGVVFGFNPDGSANVQQRNDVCSGCHGNRLGDQSCDDTWRRHLTDGFVSEVLWVDLSTVQADGSACGW